MLKKVDPTNEVLVSYLQSIDTTVVTGVLHEEEKKKPKKSKKTDGGSSKKVVKAEKKKKSPVITADTVEEVYPILTAVVDTPIIEASPSTETIPSKTGVFRRIKIKRKSQLMKKTQVTHQGVTVREIPAPVSPSSKKRRAEDLAKFLKKNQRIEEVEQVPETPDIKLQEEAKTSPPVGLSKAAVSKPLEINVGSGGVTSMEVDSLMKVMEGRVISKASRLIRDSESRVLEKVDHNDISTENRINSLRFDFVTEVKDLKIVTKERHVLFVQEVKKVREDVNLQI
ncbi:unnamed protein product [Lactuca saligna]|uniref:Uncharacterized protein n=1 Tax=Lactuca saligna TaxID=75948 RepID=A0AA35UZ87_LACSI|nr:unnamed protein product [Lactuca saligna]